MTALDKAEEAARCDFLDSFTREYALALDLLIALHDGLGLLHGVRVQKLQLRVRLSLAVSHHNALHCAMATLSRGYHKEAIALMRVAFEDWTIGQYVVAHPEQAKLFEQFDPRGPFALTPGTPRPSEIFEELGEPGRSTAPKVFDQLCAYGHPRPVGLQSTYHRDESGLWLHLGPDFSRDTVLHAFVVWFQVAQIQLNTTAGIQHDALDSVNESWLQMCLGVTDRVKALQQGIGDAIEKHTAELRKLLVAKPS